MSGSKALRVRDVMSQPVRTVGRNDRLSLADELMERGRIRHLPVLDDDGNVAGIVSRSDLFRGSLVKALGYGSVAQARVLESLVAKEVMTTEVITATPDTPLEDAARIMIEKKIGCLPVLEGGRLVGILTEGDFVALAARQG
jgi:CBS domain-containing membrane protein